MPKHSANQQTGHGPDNYLFLLMEHDMRFQTSHSGEPLVTHRTAGVVPIVGAFMKCQVELNIKGLGAQVTSMWLFGEKSQEGTEMKLPTSEGHPTTEQRPQQGFPNSDPPPGEQQVGGGLQLTVWGLALLGAKPSAFKTVHGP